MADQTSKLRSIGDIPDSKCEYVNLDFFDFKHDVLAKQFYSLSFGDRNAINEEIHGVRSMACEETPELIEDSLRLLAIELQNLPSHHKIFYERASSSVMQPDSSNSNEGYEALVADPGSEDHSHFDDDLFNHQTIPSSSNTASCYVKSRNFQLAFLRCEFFNAKDAAIRMAKYLELACDLFGEEALRRPLRIDDFKSKEEIEVLNAGHQQLLPFRDRSGRRVLALHGDLNLPTSSLMARSVLSKGPSMKLLLYLWSVLIEDVEAQRKGLVVVFWPRYIDHQSMEEDLIASQVGQRSRRTKGQPKRSKRKTRKVKNSIDDDTSDLSALVPDADSRSIGTRFFEVIPIRTCAIHVCLPDKPFFRMIRHVLLLMLGETYRTRVKTHQGM